MKVTYSRAKKSRVLKCEHKGRPMWIEPIGKGWWFVHETGEWSNEYPEGKACSSAYYAMESRGFNNIYSLKAAKRKIAKWAVPSGTWFRVNLPWIRYGFKVKKP